MNTDRMRCQARLGALRSRPGHGSMDPAVLDSAGGCAYKGPYIGHALGARIRDPGAPHNVCYPLISPDRALRIEVSWARETDEAGTAHVKATGTSDNEAKASNLRLRHEWEARLLREMFGT
jgi:hypothetical protein